MSETAIDINSLSHSDGQEWRDCSHCAQRYWGHHLCPGDERNHDDYSTDLDGDDHPYACRNCGSIEYAVERREVYRASGEIDYDGYLPFSFEHSNTEERDVYCAHCGDDTSLEYEEQ